MTRTKKTSLGSFFFNVMIDVGLIMLGFLLYYHFMVKPFGPIDLHPFVVQLFGGNKQLAVLTISGLPFIVGVFNLLKTLFLTTRKLVVSSKLK